MFTSAPTFEYLINWSKVPNIPPFETSLDAFAKCVLATTFIALLFFKTISESLNVVVS